METLGSGLNQDAWDDWIQYRKDMKFKPYKSDRMKNHMAKHSHEAQRWAVDNSMNREYQGVFPENFKGDAKSGLGSALANVAGRVLSES